MATGQLKHFAGNPVDRLGLTLFLAAALHALVILGVGFTPERHPKREAPPLSMEITLVHSHSEKEPEKADYLAQANQEGGGNVEEKVRPSSPFTNPTAESTVGESPETRPEQRPTPTPATQTVLTATRPAPTQVQAEEDSQHEKPDTLSTPNALDLLSRTQEIARTTAEIRERAQTYAQRPRKKTISANTREYAPAAYMEAWRMKVERVGNLNYPDEARRQNLSGNLILSVTIDSDGKVLKLEVVRSSGHKVLDDGALRIVRLAAPFAPLPEAIRKEADQLEIIRTWQFRDNTSYLN